MTKAPSVMIIGSALAGNKGASAMLESALATLEERLPGARFTLLSMYPTEDASQNSYSNLTILDARPLQLGVVINSLALLYRVLPPLRPLLRRHAVIDALSEADILLDQGGITFTDGREKFLLYNVASVLPAINMKVPVFKCAQAVGPFAGRINRTVSRVFLPRMHTVVTRGRITHGMAEDLGLTNIDAGADYAFSLELVGDESETFVDRLPVGFANRGDATLVGISPSVVVQKKVEDRGGDYLSIMTGFIREQRARGNCVLVLPHSARGGSDKAHNNDLPLCRELKRRLIDDPGVFVLDSELSSQQLRYLIGLCDLFLASRFHAMVSSLAMGVPTLVVGWGHKYQEVLEMFGLEQWAMAHQELNSETLSKNFAALESE
ncbi:MAG: polysaccharide pyruvyl transferase family protein, partial [Salinibacterium sp.]|nr:polysaccharide pyruvyl transferase family protein [Salinibacterium sp.]